MPIRVQYGSIRELTALAQAAGAGAARRQQEAGDIAFTQMILGTQARFAETAARLQASDRAFALQRAAMSRAARTSTRAAAIPGPIVTEMVRATREQQQLEQLELIPGLSEGEKARMKLNIAAGRTVAEAVPRPKPVSTAQQIGFWKDRWNRELKPIEARMRGLEKEITTPYDVLDDEGKIVPELQRQETHRVAALGKQLRAVRVEYDTLRKQQDQEWGEIQAGLQGPAATGAVRGPVVAPTAPVPLPARQSEWVVGTVYRAPDGRVGRWDGSKFTEVR